MSDRTSRRPAGARSRSAGRGPPQCTIDARTRADLTARCPHARCRRGHLHVDFGYEVTTTVNDGRDHESRPGARGPRDIAEAVGTVGPGTGSAGKAQRARVARAFWVKLPDRVVPAEAESVARRDRRTATDRIRFIIEVSFRRAALGRPAPRQGWYGGAQRKGAAGQTLSGQRRPPTGERGRAVRGGLRSGGPGIASWNRQPSCW
jgi:hypothetical protein